jgi:hypothetical protein
MVRSESTPAPVIIPPVPRVPPAIRLCISSNPLIAMSLASGASVEAGDVSALSEATSSPWFSSLLADVVGFGVSEHAHRKRPTMAIANNHRGGA